jgi:hypothetical protein
MAEISAFRERRFMSSVILPAPYFHTGISGESNSVHPTRQMAHISLPNATLQPLPEVGA